MDSFWRRAWSMNQHSPAASWHSARSPNPDGDNSRRSDLAREISCIWVTISTSWDDALESNWVRCRFSSPESRCRNISATLLTTPTGVRSSWLVIAMNFSLSSLSASSSRVNSRKRVSSFCERMPSRQFFRASPAWTKLMGLVKNSYTPAFINFTAISTVAYPVTTITSSPGCSSPRMRISSSPDIPGMDRSDTSTR